MPVRIAGVAKIAAPAAPAFNTLRRVIEKELDCVGFLSRVVMSRPPYQFDMYLACCVEIAMYANNIIIVTWFNVLNILILRMFMQEKILRREKYVR